ncbi:hypothetical protein M3Y94_00112200 [Aphelenchoides besseyi]|nr:hypothetical protein M3Y94_00112200 [Aphelenchoides besseyi]KAI6237492.1 hypothetical protein M3Y95_00270900 [Aphelenchoides besseyi]
MSLQLLKKSLALDDEYDGVQNKTKKKKSQHSIVQKEREMLKSNEQHYDFDLENGELKKKKLRDVKFNPLINNLSTKQAKRGYSLVDQYRSILPKDIEKRNERYLELTGRSTIPNVVTRRVTKEVNRNVKRKKKQVEARRDVGLILGTKRTVKRKPKSVFSDSDFASLSGNSNSNNLMEQFKRIR